MLHGRSFWRDAITLHGSATVKVYPDVLIVGAASTIICFVERIVEQCFMVHLELAVAPFEIVGAALGLLLILRTNAGYDRWWEARKLWGGIVNQSRNLAISGVAYGPQERSWREEFVRWSGAFSHIARSSLRGQQPGPEIAQLLGKDWSQRIAEAVHMPSFIALRLAWLLRVACTKYNLDRMAFMQIDKERALLIDHIGACERILKTPLARAYSIKIRRFLLLFLLTLPFVLLHRMPSSFMIPPICMLLAYLLLALDRIGDELQNPFSEQNLSHLPLAEISDTIGQNLLALPGDIDLIESQLEEPTVALEDPNAVPCKPQFIDAGKKNGSTLNVATMTEF